MSGGEDEVKVPGNAGEPEVQLLVVYNPATGRGQVSLPPDRMLAYAMLGMALEFLLTTRPAPARPEQKIIVPTFVPPRRMG